MSTHPGLIDRHGRLATDLRVSLTDRCNLRCTYCMPAEGLPWLPKRDLLTDAEVIRLVTIAVRDLGVTDVRFTGGEPLIRPGLVAIVRDVSPLRTQGGDPVSISLTTNGIGLDKLADDLAEAGLARINVSLDSLHRERFAASTRRDRLDDVLAGIAAADRAGLQPIKINAVPLASHRDDAPELLRFCLERGYQLRFIENMPIGPADAWHREDVISAADLVDDLTAAGFTLSRPELRGSAPAEVWTVIAPDGTAGDVGLIASVTEPFCASCTRTRLTADGQVRSCLFSTSESDLRRALRDGASDADVAQLWRDAMWTKPWAHGLDDLGFATPSRTMSAIGG